jgi:hypothetical protein
VRSIPALLVVVHVLRTVRSSSPEFTAAPNPRRRVDRSPRRISAVAAAPASLSSSCASRRCNPHLKSSPGALDRVRRRWPAAARRRPPPSAVALRRAAARTRPAPSDQDPTHLVQPAAPLNPRATTAAGSRSNGSRSSRPGSIPVNPACSRNFARKPLSFLVFTKIPFHLRSFLTV